MTNSTSKSTSELERDAERTRADLSQTLEEIRARLEPGRIVDRAFGYARENGGAEFVKTAAAQARDNPLPVLLIGAGLAWLMSGRKPAAGPSFDALHGAGVRKAHDAQDAASGAASAVAGAASSVAGAASSAASAVRDALSAGKSGVGAAGDRAGSLASSAGDTLHAGGAQIGDAVSELQRMCAENPVAVGAIGLALGAAIGAALPGTETENKLMGEEADRLKSALKDKADEGLERGERAVEAGLQAAKSSDAKSSDPKPTDPKPADYKPADPKPAGQM